jgi:hypothetical protein
VDVGKVLREAEGFADRLSSLLNGTICQGIRLNAARLPDGSVSIGRGIGKRNLSAETIPVERCTGARLYLVVSYNLDADEFGEHLMVVSSVVGLCLDERGDRELFHVDYERGKADNYPEAHLHVVADSDDWRAALPKPDRPLMKRDRSLAKRERSLAKMHLPAGGRRYRSTLEDVVHFVISEDLAKPLSGHADVLARYRDEFEERQLKAAIRRHPEVARAAVAKLDE